MKKVLWLFLGFILLSFGVTNFVESANGAQVPPLVGKINIENNRNLLPGPESNGSGVSSKDTQDYVRNKLLPGLTNTIFVFLLSVSVGTIIIAGIFYLVSNGESESTKRAKDIILWTILGVIIASLSYVLVKIIITTNFAG